MKLKLIALSGLCLLAGSAWCGRPSGLMTEYRVNPFGLGTDTPRLSWRLPEGTLRQTAYEIEVDGKTFGKVLSDAQLNVPYPGQLGVRTRTQWRIRTWDEHDAVSDWSEVASFSVANLEASDWNGAKWIGTADAQPPAFLKRFTVKGPVKSATLVISAAGFYEATLNGVRIGDKLLDPGFFDYDKRMLFSAYPLEAQLKPGENEMKVLLGHAWYDVRSHAAWDFDVAPWRDRPKFIMNLDVVYVDGSHESIVSDDTWSTTASPIVYDDIRDGEFIDPQAPAPSAPVRIAQPPKGALVASSHPATRVHAEVKPVKLWRCADGRVVVDFGVNLVGWMRMKLRNQPKGRVLSFRYDERIQKDGSPALVTRPYLPNDEGDQVVFLRHIDKHVARPASKDFLGEGHDGFQTDRYTASGAAVEIYEPRFTYNGFRYVVISGLDTVPDMDDLTAVEIGTDFRKTGSFRCSDETFNKLIEATDRSYRGNFTVGVPTDCPHREKNGWTGDAQLACELAQYFYENTSAYEKWIRDIVDAQNAEGDLPGIVPTAGWGFEWGNGPGWDAALTVVPWTIYCYRGDVRGLEEAYPAICRYLAFTAKKSEGGLVKHGLGDWCAVDPKKMPTVEYTSSLYYYQAQTLAARIAAVLKRPVESARFAAGAAKTREAIVAKYYHGEGIWDDGRQTAQAMALGFGIVPEGDVKATEEKLIASVLKEDGQADFGIFGSKTVFRALSNAGRTDLAFQLAAGHGQHQFGAWIDRGATTLWEHMNGTSSLNHIMFGDFAAWACQYLAGIRLAPSADWADMLPSPTKPAFKDMLIEPTPIKALSFAEADILTPYGRVFSRWDREGRTIRYRIILPPGTTARFRAPGLAETVLGPGTHVFSSADLSTENGMPIPRGREPLRTQSAEEIKVDFARGKWNPSEWLTFKSLRWEYTNGFDQMDDHIVNHAPAGMSDEELYEKHVGEVYSSIVYPQKLSGTVGISSTMSFDHLMAPLIVLTPELDTDDKGRYAFKKHYEIVLYNEGLNVWHYTYENGKLAWHLAAFARAKFEPKKRYELKVEMKKGKREMRMTVECGDVKFGFEDPDLPESFYAGVTGCEGRNRFYDFRIASSTKKFNPLADGEH